MRKPNNLSLLSLATCLLVVGGLLTPAYGQYVVRPGNNAGNLITPLPDFSPTIPNVPTPPTPNMPINPSGSFPFYPGYNIDFYGYQGIADIINARGQVMMDSEWARILREQANQANLKTQKAKFDLKRYIEDNTPKWSDYQKKILRTRLARIREQATTTEIFNGSALNLLVDDLDNRQFQTISVQEIPDLEKGVLSHINVSAPGNSGNLGLLRNAGKFTWPVALHRMLSDEERSRIEKVTGDLVANVSRTGEAFPVQHADVSESLDKIVEDMKKNKLVLKTPTRQYLQAKRFLNEFNDAMRVLEKPTLVKKIADFQLYAAEDRSIKELVGYMNKNGLRFAPATQGDEFAYQAVYSALASYDVAFNMMTSAKKGQ